MLREDDRVRLQHMLDAAQAIQRFTAGRKRGDLNGDQMLSFAVIRGFEVIGEAASQVSEAGRAACPGLAWSLIVGMRNRLIHAYFDVNLDRVWDTVTNDLPTLIEALARTLSGNATNE